MHEQYDDARKAGMPVYVPGNGEYRFVLMIIALIVLANVAFAVRWVIDEAIVANLQKSPLAYVYAMLLTLTLAGVCYCIREIKSWRRWYLWPPFELGISMGLSVVAVKQGVSPVLNFVAIMAAVRVAIDAIKRFKEFREEG